MGIGLEYFDMPKQYNNASAGRTCTQALFDDVYSRMESKNVSVISFVEDLYSL